MIHTRFLLCVGFQNVSRKQLKYVTSFLEVLHDQNHLVSSCESMALSVQLLRLVNDRFVELFFFSYSKYRVTLIKC